LLAQVYYWFTEGFDTADLQEAKALLDVLQEKYHQYEDEKGRLRVKLYVEDGRGEKGGPWCWCLTARSA
jgi:hypothetical protein